MNWKEGKMKELYFINKDDPDWKDKYLLERKKGIGASDVAAVCDCSPFGSSLSVWYDKKTKEIIQQEDNIAMDLGTFLEPFLANKFVKQFKKFYNFDVELKEMPYILAYDKNDIYRCTLDRYFYDQTGIFVPVELKSTSEYRKDDWAGEEMPKFYYYQVQWQIFVTGTARAFVGFLIGNRTFDIKVVPRNDKVIDMLVERVNNFWYSFVVPGIAPAPDGSASAQEIINLLNPLETTGKTFIVNEGNIKQLRTMVSEYDSCNDIKKDNEAKMTKIRQQFAMMMGDAEEMVVDGRKIDFKTINKHVSAYDSTYRTVMIRPKK